METRTFKIAQGKTRSYAKVMAKESLRISLFVFGAFAVLMLLMIQDKIVALVSVAGLLGLFSIVGIIVYFSSLAGAINMGKAAYYTLSDHFVSLDHNREQLSGMIKFGAARNKARTGETIDRKISISEIGSTTINKNGIIIKNASYNMILSPNGRIFIPKEIEEYDRFKTIILNNKTRFKHA